MEHFRRRCIVFQRGQYLYTAFAERQEVHHVQRLVDGKALFPRRWDEELPQWSVSPDAKQIAFHGATPSELVNEIKGTCYPQTVYIASLPDLKDKRILFTTAQLQDSQGRLVTSMSPFSRLPHQAKRYPLPAPEVDGWWEITSLRWGQDGKRLYISLRYANTLGGYATCAVDVHTGRAITDAAGNWRRFIPAENIDENENYLVGIGLGRTLDEPDVCNACSKYFPLYIVAKSGATPTSLLPTQFTSKKIPPYANAGHCAIAPSGDYIAFSSNKTLWLTSIRGGRYVRLLSQGGEVSALAWIGDHTLLYYRRDYPARNVGSLWSLALRSASSGEVIGSPRLLLRDVNDLEALPQ